MPAVCIKYHDRSPVSTSDAAASIIQKYFSHIRNLGPARTRSLISRSMKLSYYLLGLYQSIIMTFYYRLYLQMIIFVDNIMKMLLKCFSCYIEVWHASLRMCTPINADLKWLFTLSEIHSWTACRAQNLKWLFFEVAVKNCLFPSININMNLPETGDRSWIRSGIKVFFG